SSRGKRYLETAGLETPNKAREAAGRPSFANPPDAAARSLKHLDPNIAAKRPLGMIFYGTCAIEGTEVDRHSKIFPLFKKLGLPTHEHWSLADSVDQILKAIHDLDQIRRGIQYETYGMVVKVDEI